MDIADEAWSEVKFTASDGSDVAALYISHVLENYNSDEDQAFITTARTAFPRLLAAVEAALKQHRKSMFPAGPPGRGERLRQALLRGHLLHQH